MAAGKYHLTIEQGATFARTFTWKDENDDPIDLTSYTARAKMKTPSGTEIASLTDADGLTLGGAAGTIAMELSADATAAMTFEIGVWDLELEDDNDVVTRLLEGDVWLSREVTTEDA